MKRIKLMADYKCYPLWGTITEEFVDISPAELPISLELQHNLNEWAKKYDAVLNMDDPISSGFESEAEEKIHRRRLYFGSIAA